MKAFTAYTLLLMFFFLALNATADAFDPADPNSVNPANPTDQPFRSISTYTPPQYEIGVESTGKSLVTIAIPLITIEENLRAGIAKSFVGAQQHPELKAIEFRNFSPNSTALEIYADIDSDVARCGITLKFSLPAASPKDLIVQDNGSDADCRSSAPSFLDIPTRLRNAVLDGARSTIGKALLGDSNIKDWIKEDALWADLINKAVAQGSYCATRVGNGLCLKIAWPQRDELTVWLRKLVAAAPVRTSPINKNLLNSKLAAFREAALNKTMKVSSRISGYRYPAELHDDGTYGDGDMLIFGGLLCASGEPEGCKLVSNSRSADGRFWRSPDKVNNLKPDESSFSGDQFNGAVAFLSSQSDKAIFHEYLSYILNTRQDLPSQSNSIYKAYKTCSDDKAYQCVLAGPEWMWLQKLAMVFGETNNLPADVSNPETFFGFNYDAMLWQAALSPAGYRLHLTGVQVLLARILGGDDKKLQLISAVLAGRQPENPFFLYLHLGNDQRIENLLYNMCSTTRQQARYDDWAWQRASSQQAWNNSMIWDCVFLYGLLNKHPISTAPTHITN